MNADKHLEGIDLIIMDILYHYEKISLMDLWYELGESHDLNGQSVTKDEVLNRLEVLSTSGFLKNEGADQWVLIR